MTDFIQTTLLYPKALLLICSSFGLFAWAVYLAAIKRPFHKRIMTTYSLLAICLVFWLLTNAYFQSPLLVQLETSWAIKMAKLANIASSFAGICAFYFSCVLRDSDKKIKLWEKSFIAFAVFGTLALNLAPGLTVIAVKIAGPSDFELLQGPLTPFFFGIGVMTVLLTLRNFFLMKREGLKVKQEKAYYLLVGFLLLMFAVLIFHVLVPLFLYNYRFAWIPPIFAVVEMSFFAYALLADRFCNLKILAQRGLVYFSGIVLYFIPLFIFLYAMNGSSLMVKAVVLVVFALLIAAFWNRTLLFFSKFYNNIIYGKGTSPLDEIRASLASFQSSATDGLHRLAKAVNVSQAGFAFAGDDSYAVFSPYFARGACRVLVKDEIDYKLQPCAGSLKGYLPPEKRREIEKLQKEMEHHKLSLALPVLNQSEEPVGILLLKEKEDGKLFSAWEIKELKVLIESAKVYIIKDSASHEAEKEMAPFFAIPDDFFPALYHEGLTPVQILLGLSEYLDRSELHEKGREYFDLLMSARTKLYFLFENINEGFLWQSGRLRLDKSYFQIENMPYSICRMLDPDGYPEIEPPVSFHIPDEICGRNYYGDFYRLDIAFCEIIKNGLFFNHSENKNVSMTVSEINDCLIFDFEDNGIGIHESAWEKIFGLLTVLSPSRSRTECGIGAGLTIARGIIQAHGGKLYVLESEPGKRTVFRAEIPISELEQTAGLLSTPLQLQEPKNRSI